MAPIGIVGGGEVGPPSTIAQLSTGWEGSQNLSQWRSAQEMGHRRMPVIPVTPIQIQGSWGGAASLEPRALTPQTSRDNYCMAE